MFRCPCHIVTFETVVILAATVEELSRTPLDGNLSGWQTWMTTVSTFTFAHPCYHFSLATILLLLTTIWPITMTKQHTKPDLACLSIYRKLCYCGRDQKLWRISSRWTTSGVSQPPRAQIATRFQIWKDLLLGLALSSKILVVWNFNRGILVMCPEKEKKWQGKIA